MVEKGCSKRAVLDGLTKRPESSMLTIGVLFIQAMIAGGMQKLLPVLTAASNLGDTFSMDSRKDFARPTVKRGRGVFGPRGFVRGLTLPNSLNLFQLKGSSLGARKDSLAPFSWSAWANE